MKVFISYIRQRAGWIAADFLCIIIMGGIIHLNRVPLSEWQYAAILCLFILAVFGGYDFFRYDQRHKKLVRMRGVIGINVEALGLPSDIVDEDYQELIRAVYEDKVREINRLKNRYSDMTEYYTMWVHQIKTPIAAMNLLLQQEDTPANHELLEELFRIEQYVEMTLHYLRLNADSNDFVIRRTDLDKIAREAVRKYARFFIRKKIRLNYEPLNTQIISDEKWLGFVIEQLISNAVKYTPGGTISIYMKKEGGTVLVIEDTGIGIRAEDLPRVCEKGYTGYNGRDDRRSTGIGLYLCKRMLNRLSHSIEIESEVGKGTRVMIRFDEEGDSCKTVR